MKIEKRSLHFRQSGRSVGLGRLNLPGGKQALTTCTALAQYVLAGRARPKGGAGMPLGLGAGARGNGSGW